MPRKPGGKYKGMIGRTKGDESAQIAANKARKAQEAYIKKMMEKRQKDLMAVQGKTAKEEEEEKKRQMALNLLMGGGKKGTLKKMFRNWITGMRNARKERLIREREIAWRRTCGHFNPVMPKGCSSTLSLTMPSFRMPSDFGYGFGGQSSPSCSHGHTGRPLLDPDAVRALLPPSDGQPGSEVHTARSLARSLSTPLLPTVRRTGLQGSQMPSEPWLKKATTTKVFHQSTTRHCYLDSSLMRIGYVDEDPRFLDDIGTT